MVGTTALKQKIKPSQFDGKTVYNNLVHEYLIRFLYFYFIQINLFGRTTDSLSLTRTQKGIYVREQRM